ncbi:MotA/TolQ/ExbB proton channel family protein [Synechococcus sp. FGCU-3]|nr:MotA/TolQ/ExbB proton channel family protein [Synechococcus sp. FGCU3]
MIDLLIATGITAIPILLLSIVSLALVIERLIFWVRIKKRQTNIMGRAFNLYQQSPGIAEEFLEKHKELPTASIFLDAMRSLRIKPNDYRLAFQTALDTGLPVFRKYNNYFQLVVTVAPLLGLLGTVLGLTNSFKAMAATNLSGGLMSQVSAGISEALLSTIFGLVVAVFTLIFASLFRSLAIQEHSRVKSLIGRFELLYYTQE